MIVPAHEGANCIGACLQALRALVPAPEVIVVDNASSDDTAQLVRARFPECRVLESARNEGFGAACNRGAALARGEVLLFLNQDAELSAPLEPALRRFAAEAELGVLGARVRYPDGRLQPSQGRAFGAARLVLHWYAYPLRVLGWRRAGALLESEPSAYERARDVPWVSGCCVLVRRALFAELGGFGSDYFMYAEDLDLCTRARARGARVAYEPALEVRHAERGGATGLSEFALVHTVAGHAAALVSQGGRARAALALAALLPCFGAFGLLGGLAAGLTRSARGLQSARAFRAGGRQAARSLSGILRGDNGAAGARA